MGEQDARTAHLIGREYLSTRWGIVGPLVRSVVYRGTIHFWLDLGDCCALVSVMGTAAVGVFLPDEVAACRRRNKRWARHQEYDWTAAPAAPAFAGAAG